MLVASISFQLIDGRTRETSVIMKCDVMLDVYDRAILDLIQSMAYGLWLLVVVVSGSRKGW